MKTLFILAKITDEQMICKVLLATFHHWLLYNTRCLGMLYSGINFFFKSIIIFSKCGEWLFCMFTSERGYHSGHWLTCIMFYLCSINHGIFFYQTAHKIDTRYVQWCQYLYMYMFNFKLTPFNLVCYKWTRLYKQFCVI